jgi:hypothetical protein
MYEYTYVCMYVCMHACIYTGSGSRVEASYALAGSMVCISFPCVDFDGSQCQKRPTTEAKETYIEAKET